MIFAAALKGSCRDREGEGDAAYVNAGIHQWLNFRHPPGILLCYVSLQYVSRQRMRNNKREIDRLTEQFQELFRQNDQDKQQGL